MKLISVDDHLYEHATVWSDRLAQKYQEDGPQRVEVDGFEYWKFESNLEPAFIGLGAASGRPVEKYSKDLVQTTEVIPGSYNPVARLADMDEDGVWAQLCFPSYPRFAGTRFLHAKDKALALACIHAYNDFVFEEWCAAAPDRYIPLAIVPLWDVNLAVAELRRTAVKGARSISFPEQTSPLGLPSIHSGYWDPFFAVAAETGIPLSIHFGTSGASRKTSDDAPDAIHIALMGVNSMTTCADFLFSHAFHTFPGLKIALSEGGVGWIPWLKDRMDYTFERQRFWSGINKDVRPSELFAEHVYGCFIDDEVGVQQRERIGVNNMMIESDYPHSDSSWPHTRKRATEVLRDVPDDEAQRIASLNASYLYRFDI